MYERRNTDRKLTDWLNDSACCGYFPAFLLSMHVLQKSSVSFPVKFNYTLLHELLYKTIYCWNAPSNKYICRISTENWWRNYQTDISKRRKKKKLELIPITTYGTNASLRRMSHDLHWQGSSSWLMTLINQCPFHIGGSCTLYMKVIQESGFLFMLLLCLSSWSWTTRIGFFSQSLWWLAQTEEW